MADKAKTRTDAELIASYGTRGKLAVLARHAFPFADKQGFAGTVFTDKTTQEKTKEVDGKKVKIYIRPWNTALYPIIGTSGRLFKMEEDDPRVIAVEKTAKAAAKDVFKENYTDNVKKFIDTFVKEFRGEGGRVRDRGILSDLF